MSDKQILAEQELDAVAGGAIVVEVNKDDKYIPRCFSCKSTNVSVALKNGVKTITCNDCGAVDFIRV